MQIMLTLNIILQQTSTNLDTNRLCFNPHKSNLNCSIDKLETKKHVAMKLYNAFNVELA